MSDDQEHIEEMIRSVSDLPRPSAGFKKRVQRAARRAEKERNQKRWRWSLSLSAASLALVVGVYSYMPRHSDSPASAQSQPDAQQMDPTHPADADWRYVEKLKQDRAVQSGMISGTH